jgi:AcrR family transcriptional regulator
MARTRSARAHEDVLAAALELFAARGIDATSVDAIAEASGVSKATIYKHWPDKDALCLEVMVWVHGRDRAQTDVDTGDLRADLIRILSHQPPEEHTEARSRLMPHLMAYGVRNPSFGKAWRARVLEPPRAELTNVLQQAVARGLLPRGLVIDVAIAQLFGPMMYAHVLTLIDHDSPAGIRELVVDAFMRSYGAAQPGTGASPARTEDEPVRRKPTGLKAKRHGGRLP